MGQFIVYASHIIGPPLAVDLSLGVEGWIFLHQVVQVVIPLTINSISVMRSLQRFVFGVHHTGGTD